MQKTSFHTKRVRLCLIALLVVGWLLVGLKLPGLADEAKKVAVDASGNVYVTGKSSNGANNDYVTIKYSASGAWLWGRRYNGPANSDDEPSALAVDASGNVYVTGKSWNGVSDDYVTIKYSKDGNWLWGRRYNGPANGEDGATALAVDAAGNVYVTGWSLNGPNYDYVTIKYSASGNWVWGRRYNGPANDEDGAYALAVDATGNVYVTGWSSNGPNYDYVTIKYSASGNWMWGRRYNGPANDDDFAQELVLDAGGNVFVTGTSDNSTNADYVTVKYDQNGNWLWGRRYNGPSNSTDEVIALAVDGAGNVAVTGKSFGVLDSDFVTIKYSAFGEWVWGARYDGPAHYIDVATALRVDVGGNVFVTGWSSDGANIDYVTIKYNAFGEWVWGARYDGPANWPHNWDEPTALAVDAPGNVYVTGNSSNGANFDYVTIKYSSGGAWLWGARYDGPDNGHIL